MKLEYKGFVLEVSRNAQRTLKATSTTYAFTVRFPRFSTYDVGHYRAIEKAKKEIDRWVKEKNKDG